MGLKKASTRTLLHLLAAAIRLGDSRTFQKTKSELLKRMEVEGA